MAYEVNFTDRANKGSIIVDDNTINQETSVDLPGRNSTAYGTSIAENFLHLLENFANTLEPTNPVEGQLWYDSSPGVNQLKVYDGTAWAAAGGLKKALAEPDVNNSVTGDLWVDTDNQQLYLFSGSGWVLVGPNFSDGLNTGARPVQLTGTDDTDYSVLIIEVEAQPAAIISTSLFTPKVAIAGFSSIKPGINLTTRDITGAGIAKFNGTSEKAEALVVGNTTVPSSNFLRTDQVSITNFPIRIKNNTGLQLGTASQLSIGVEGEAGVITHNTSGAQINIRTNDGGVTRNVLTLDGTNVGVNNGAPDQALDVIGNIQTDSNLLVDGATQSDTFSTGAAIIKGGVGIAKNLNIGGNVKIEGGTQVKNLTPDLNNQRILGTELIRWQAVYANTFFGNLVGDITGTITGKSTSTDKLASQTTFRMSGDVSAPDFTFDGQTGGTTKTFSTSISNSFVANKPSLGSTEGDDEILINRVTGQTGLYKVSRRALLSSVPTNPPGIILPFGGTSIPEGWLLCDGREVLQVLYPTLFEVIGFNFKDASGISDGGIEYFALPDLRGRMPLGLDNMGGSAADRVTGLAASELGNSGGSEDVNIGVDNLPDHEHDLRADNGDQFYAISDLTRGPSSDPGSIVYDAPTGTGVGQALATSGGVLNPTLGDALNVMNPFLAINYIIYHGEV